MACLSKTCTKPPNLAKKSIIARWQKTQKQVHRFQEKRNALKQSMKKATTTEEILNCMIAIDKLPKNASNVRLNNRCNITGRSRGYLRKFGISRIKFREMAAAGKIPGIKKASW